MKKILNFKTVRKRMVFSFVSLFLCMVILMGISIYNFTCKLLIEKNQESYSSMLRISEEVFKERLSSYTELVRIILYNPSVQKVLSEEDLDDGIYMNQSRTTELEDVFQSYANGIDGIESIYLFDNKGKLYYQDQNKNSREVRETIDFNIIEKTKWYQSAIEVKGKEIFLGHDVLWGSSDVISCVKTMNQLNSSKKNGMLVVNINRSSLKNVVSLAPVSKEIFAIIYKDNQREELVYENGYDTKMFEESVQEIVKNEKNKYEITTHECVETGWEICHIVEKKNIFQEASKIRMIVILSGAIAILFVILLSIFEAIRITKPLNQLRDNIQSAGKGIREFDNTFASDDEIGEIGFQFQKMIKEKIELKEKISEEELLRKDSELQLLQSQINPHFLYNTLDTLYWMAIDKDAEEVADLTQSLSNIFRTSLNNGEEYIKVSDEIRFIEDYLHVQNVRFEGKFIVKIRVDQEIEKLRIVKQILQPFVENAIYHGLEPMIGQGLLSVIGKIEKNYLIFEIQDDGVGISKDVEVMKGYAVSNVYQRIKLHYGERADILFDSELGKGTRVQILLPIEEVKNVENCIG